jgi:hypothetical protein
VVVGECVTVGLILGVSVKVGVIGCVPAGSVEVIVSVVVTEGMAPESSGWKGVGDPGSRLSALA